MYEHILVFLLGLCLGLYIGFTHAQHFWDLVQRRKKDD